MGNDPHAKLKFLFQIISTTQYRTINATMDAIYTTPAQKRRYERTVAKDPIFAKCEQDWYDRYMSPIQDIFGCPEVIEKVHTYYSHQPGTLEITQNQKPPRDKVTAKKDIMCSRGTEYSTHWLAKRKGDTSFFDPYDEFQSPGTNQWCQLNSMMHLCVADRPVSTIPTLEKYYEYNQQVIEFVQHIFADANLQPVIDAFWSDLDLPGTKEECVAELLAHPNRCFNIVIIG